MKLYLLAPGALSHGAQMNLIMKINLILKADVEWHNKDDQTSSRATITLQLIAAFLTILASLLSILCH